MEDDQKNLGDAGQAILLTPGFGGAIPPFSLSARALAGLSPSGAGLVESML